MYVIRACRPHDKLAYSLHAAGYSLTATGTSAFSDHARTSPSTELLFLRFTLASAAVMHFLGLVQECIPSPRGDFGSGGGSIAGPDHPLFTGRIGGQQPGFSGALPPGAPPDAHFDPYGPPGVPGFEPDL